MPNYRNKNKNKRNKNRNKNSNQNKNSQEQQQQQQNEEQPKSKKTAAKVHDKELLQRQQPAEAVVDEQQHVGCIPNMPVRTQSSDDDDLIAARSTPPTAETHRIICNAPEQLPASEEVSCTEQVAPETTTGNAMPIGDADTVSRDTSTNIERLPAGSSSIITKTTVPLAEDFLMGATNSKQQIEARNQSSIITTGLHDEGAEMRTISITRQQGKVIVHRVIQEGTASTSEEEISSISSQPDESDPKLIIHAQQEASPDTAVSTANATVTIHQEDPECTEVTEQVATQEAKIIVHKVSQQEYRVDSPQPKVTEKQAPKLRKTRSLDDDEEESQLQIQEISDNSSGGENDNPPLISEAESESEEDRTIVLDTNDNGEPSRSAAPNQDNYKQRRAQKRAAIENHFLPQFLIPRYLDSILEENSDMSDARSEKSNIALSRSTSGNFEDEQHDDEHETKAKKANAVFPRSNLDFTKKHKHGTVPKAPTQQAIIREETVPMMVEAKIIEQPIIVERCSTWSSAQTPESEAAEVVYINSASSSVSDLLDLDYEDALAGSSRSSVDLDTDVNEIFSKPSKAYIELTHIDPMIDDQRERTPVNETSSLAAIVAEPTHSISKSTTTTNTFTQITNERTLKQCKTSGQSSSEQLLAANKNTSSTHSALASHDCNTSKAENSEISKNYILAKAADTSATTSPTSCVSIANDNVQYSEILRNFQMNDIREILNDVANKSSVNTSASVNRSSVAPIVPHRVAPPPPDKGFYCLHDDPPPPIPPPPQTYNQPQVVDTVASPDFHLGEPISAHNCNNNTDSIHTSHQQQQQPTLPQPNTSSLLARQESGDSHGSDSTTHSQCTAINIDSLTHSDWADFDAESSVSGGISAPTTDGSVAEDQSVNLESSEAGSTICLDDYKDKDKDSDSAIKKLRLLCTQTLASMPYGEDILEELASVAQNIGEARATKTITKAAEMPYPLPNLPHITDIQVSMSSSSSSKPTNVTLTQVPPTTTKEKLASPPPPPVPEPPSKYESWLGVPTESDPKLLVCLSPSQRSFMADDKASAGNKPDHLLDAHKKFVERRGYHEYTAEQVNAINMERTAEHQIIQTAAMMKQLRKSLTPPPLPPPPVPRKSSDTKAKAQKQQQQQQQQQQKQQREKQTTYDNSNSFKNANEQRSLFDDEDENKHRLLAIIHDDTNEVQQNRPPAAAASSSSSSAAYENNSRQTSAQTALPADEKEAQAQSSTAPLIQKQEQKSSTFEKTTNFAKNSISSKQSELIDTSSYQNKYSTRSSSAQQQSEAEKQISTEPFVQTNSSITNNKMQGIDSEFSKLFPSLGNTDIFDSAQKRFSNIETSNKEQFSAKLADKQTKRFSNIETSSYESKKRIENGHVVYDVSDSKRESFTDGDKPDSSILHFPVAERTEPSNAGHKSSTSTQQTSFGASTESCTNTSTAPTDVGEIMSALNLNTSAAGVPPPQTNAAAYTSSHSTANKETKEQFQKTINRQNSENSTFNKHISGTYEEFRQRAKAAAEAATKPLTAPLTSNGDNKPKSVFHFDHEKLFKDFDELSKQLNFELESGKAKKEQREKSASLFDLSRIQNESKTRFEEIKRQRHEHMQELEREIERSRRARQFMIPIQLENGTEHASRALNRTQSQSRTIKIPIHIENRNQHQNPASAPIVKDSRTYEIPVQVDPGYREDRFRRAESMFDLSDSQAQPGNLYRQHTASSNQTESSHFDDWKRYASDLGSSENISRPFAREVEICYQRCKPHTIRAPRMTASTNDLTATNHSYDYHNAFNVRRTHAPMLNQVPQKTRPQYLSCHSMIERDPNPTYISTTSRRGVSPAPATMQSAETNAASVSHENEVRQQRRASLPREIHEQQLKYISSKEQELKTEFERLENERRRLLEEMNRAPTMPMPSPRAFRPSLKLPTLSEDEVFRQQMAEEWLSKVAEREERRLHKIIKISKISEEAGINATTMQPPCPKIDIGDEFLKRVKERRSKLAMPSDSDWESGAESHPVAQGQVSENEEVPPVKIIEGRSETDLRQLPKHMREFAKFSNHEREELDGGHREVHQEEERREESKDNSMSSAVKKSSIVKTYKVSRVPGGGPVTFATPRAEAAARKPSRTENASKEEELRHKRHQLKASIQLQQHQKQQHHPHHHQHHHHHNHYHQLLPIDSRDSQQHHKTIEQPALVVSATTANNKSINSTNTKLQQNLANAPAKRRKQTRFLLTPNRRSWSESDLLREIDNELQLAKGFLFADEPAQSSAMFAPKFKAQAPSGRGIWTPKNQTPTTSSTNLNEILPSTPTTSTPTPPPQPAQPIWTPQPSPTSGRKEFRPVRFESPTLPRRYTAQSQPATAAADIQPPWSYTAKNNQNNNYESCPLPTPPRSANSCTNLSTPNTTVSSSTIYCDSHYDEPLSISSLDYAVPTASVLEKIKTFERSSSASELHRPITRHKLNSGSAIYRPNEVIYNVKHEYMSEPETENDRPRKMAQLARRQYDGIGPVTNDGMPIILRSEVKEPHQHEWYKRLYQTIHKQKNGDDYVIRYKCPRGRYQHKANGYVSEPEPNNESDYSTIKYRTLDRRRLQSTSSSTTNVRNASSTCQDDTIYGTMPNPIKSGQNSYKNQPGRIEDYVTGHSSVSEKEKKEWWDEVMDIFNGWLKDHAPTPRIFIEFANQVEDFVHLDQTKLSPLYTEGNLSRALAKESGYASDSNLVFHKKEVPLRNPLSPVEQKQAYKSVQSGGEPPLFGFRKPAPEKPKDYDVVSDVVPPQPPRKGVPLETNERRPESPNRYFESDVNIHYKTPIRYEYKERIPEEELAIRQAEQMQKLYQEERRRKYLQELQDMNSRRHTDNFTPSQKSPIPLNRYDDFQSDLAPKSPNTVLLTKTIARALYNFQGQTARELTFRKGDVIYIRRQIDKNWYEGEHNAMIGLLPANYVEIISRDGARQPLRKPSEGQARAKYNFQAQSGIELSLNKGELVTLTRRVDKNWFEGKIANRKGIFPVCYVEVLSDIGTEDYSAPRAVMTSSGMRPSLDSLRTSINNEFNTITQNGHQPPNGILRETRNMQKTDVLHVDTSTSPIAYRALYKYRPQNSDELELLEGDLIHVLEKCDDGWFVGTSQRTGCFGTFPGNYVERA